MNSAGTVFDSNRQNINEKIKCNLPITKTLADFL